MGYTNVRHYVGGLADWTERGGAIEGARATGSTRSAVEEPTVRQPTATPASRRTSGWLKPLATSPLWTLLGLWAIVVVGCGGFYWIANTWSGPALLADRQPVGPGLAGFLTALYFSTATATSVGYGDVVPVGFVRVLAVLESAAGLLLFGLLVSRFVSRKQDQTIVEIHRIAFEDRLGRVRTNLHLVLRDLQGFAEACGERDSPRDRVMTRVESAAIVFIGELRAVHDLLYRPQEAPEETVLEGILAGVASALLEFVELAGQLPRAGERPPLMQAAFTKMASLALEICGECVPREYAPALKEWMNQIQELAGRLRDAQGREPARP
jgi:potassium channel LctB